MALQPTRIIRLGILALASLLAATGVCAQVSKLDDLAKRIATELKPLKPSLVAIADFLPPGGSTLPQGHYFAWILSSILQDREKNKFTVADHIGFDSDLAKLNIPVTSLVPGEAFQSAAPQLGVDVLITGTIERRDHTYQ